LILRLTGTVDNGFGGPNPLRFPEHVRLEVAEPGE
jgi:hypothetical protein